MKSEGIAVDDISSIFALLNDNPGENSRLLAAVYVDGAISEEVLADANITKSDLVDLICEEALRLRGAQ